MSGGTLAPALAVLHIELGVVAYLERLPSYLKPHLGELRREIGCTVGELHSTIEAMRAGGRLLPDKLALAPATPIISVPDATAETTGAEDWAEVVRDGPAEVLGTAVPLAAPPAVSLDPLAPDAPGPVLLRAIEIYCAATGTPETRIGKVLFNYPGFVGLLRRRGRILPQKIEAVRAMMADHPDGLPTAPIATAAPAPAAAPPPVTDDALDDFLRNCTVDDTGGRVRGSFLYELYRAWAGSTGAVEMPAKRFSAGMSARGYQAKHSNGIHWIGVKAIRSADDFGTREPSVDLAARADVQPVRPPRSVSAALGDLTLTPIETIQTMVAETPADLLRAVGRTHAALWRRCVLLGRLADETPAAALYRALGAGLDVIEADFNEEHRGTAHG